MWTAFVALARVERGQLVAELSDRASHGGDEEAALAIRQLARMPKPPLDALVAAAAAPSRPVADEAQLAINDLMRRWQRQAKSGKSRQVLRQLETLAQRLDHHSEAFTPRDYPWLARTASKVIQLANRASPDGNAALAAHCDALLALARPSATDDQPTVVARPPAAIHPEPLRMQTSAEPALPDSVFTPLPTSALDTLRPERAVASSKSPLQFNPASVGWNPRWSPPTVAAQSPASSPLTFRPRRSTTVPSTPSDSAVSAADQWNSFDTHTLLKRWHAAKGRDATEIQRELAARGFANLSADLVEPLLSHHVADRERLVFAVMDMPGIDAQAWLVLLAEDADPGVRFAAVSMMATSNNPALVEKALQVALHDRDPQVASLAERLRNRRTSARRR